MLPMSPFNVLVTWVSDANDHNNMIEGVLTITTVLLLLIEVFLRPAPQGRRALFHHGAGRVWAPRSLFWLLEARRLRAPVQGE